MRLVALALAIVAGCSVPAAEPTAASSESSLRALAADEIVGDIAYGETKDVDVTPAPKYRAFAFEGVRGDTIEARVTAKDGTDPILWLTDAAFNTIAVSDNPRPTDTNPVITRTLMKTGKHYLVFREMTFAPRARFSVTLTKTDAVPLECDPDGEGFASPDCTEGTDPFAPDSCSGPALTAAKLGTGLDLTDAKIYYRTRQCTAGACSPWVRAFAVDVTLAKIVPGASPTEWSFVAATTRPKVKVDFTIDPGALKQLCVDGPFAALRGGDWTPLADGTPGVCGSAVASPAVLADTCARIETPTIELASADSTQTTEYAAVLLARY